MINKRECFLPAGAQWATGIEGGNESQKWGSIVPDPSPNHPFKGSQKFSNVKHFYNERSRHDFVF